MVPKIDKGGCSLFPTARAVGEGRRKWNDHSKGPMGIKLITLQGRWGGHLLELRGRERPSQAKGVGRESVLIEVTEQPSSEANG